MNHYAAELYRRVPVWSQNLMLSAFSALLERERTSGGFHEFQSLLARSERWSRTELEAYQDERLQQIVADAYENVPYYRRRFDDLGLSPKDIRGRSDLPKIPLLTRDDIRAHFDDLRSRRVSPRSLRTGHTSGTTGTPLTVGYSREAVWMTYAAFDRVYRWAGCVYGKGGDRVAVARGNVIVPLDQRKPPYWRFNRRLGQMLLSSFHLSSANLPAYFEAMKAFGPTVLDGYPSTLYLLAKFLQNRAEVFPLRAAVTSSETLYDFQRELIEDRFQCRVFDYYALAERVLFSNECDRHQGHHIAMEFGIAEIVDQQGHPAATGATGKLVGTSLHNWAMPLLRYVTNDMTALRPAGCSCGRALELMDDVTTKAEDLLTLPDGRLISPSVLTHPFKPLDCIEGSQIHQTAPDSIVVRIVPGAAYSGWHTSHLIAELQARLGDAIRIDVQLVDRLEQSANGKFKWVISEVPLGI